MNRTGVRLGRVLCLAGAIAGTALVAGRAAGGQSDSRPSPIRGPTHLVERGDTIWEIARARVGEAGDPRPLVQAIREANGLDGGSVHPGEVLVIPLAP